MGWQRRAKVAACILGWVFIKGDLLPQSAVWVALLNSDGGLPAVRQQFIDPALRPAAGKLSQHIGDIWERRNAVEGARSGYAVQDCRTSRCLMRAEEEKVVAAKRDRPQLALA